MVLVLQVLQYFVEFLQLRLACVFRDELKQSPAADFEFGAIVLRVMDPDLKVKHISKYFTSINEINSAVSRKLTCAFLGVTPGFACTEPKL